ncbi:MAG: hypothetical protein QHH75_15225 [Bacillota bacterium]|nr:hypothetical protein [Bacillota bacterium]
MTRVLNVREKTGREVLTGSRDGIAFALKVVEELDKLAPGEILLIDLVGIKMMDVSYANQAFVNPMKMLIEENKENNLKAIRFKVSNEIIKSVLSRVLYDHGLLALVMLNDTIEVIGSVGRSINDAFRKIFSFGEVSIDTLPSLMGVDENTCINRIRRLIFSGVIKEYDRDGKKLYAVKV